MRKIHNMPLKASRGSRAGRPPGSLDGVDATMMGSIRFHRSFASSILILLHICNLMARFYFEMAYHQIFYYEAAIGIKKIEGLTIDELVKSRPEAMFVNDHGGHEKHEVEIMIYFFAPSCSSCPSWWKLDFLRFHHPFIVRGEKNEV